MSVGLSSDVARGSQTVKAAYREVVESMIRLLEANSKGPKAREQALVLIALCVGGMVLARGLDDEDLADETSARQLTNMPSRQRVGARVDLGKTSADGPPFDGIE